jgi:hypothetical protein
LRGFGFGSASSFCVWSSEDKDDDDDDDDASLLLQIKVVRVGGLEMDRPWCNEREGDDTQAEVVEIAIAIAMAIHRMLDILESNNFRCCIMMQLFFNEILFHP